MKKIELNKGKNVLFIATVQSHIMNFHVPYLNYFQSEGYTVYVACKLDKEKYTNIEKLHPNIIWIDVDFSRNPFSFKTITTTKEICKLMKNIKFNLVHVHTPVGSIVGRIGAKITNTAPVIYTAHGFHFFKGAPIKNWLLYYPAEKITSKFTDAIITMNNEDYLLAKKFLKPRKKENVFRVNGVGIDIDRYKFSEMKDINYKKSIGLNEDDFVITVVAELIDRKNHKQLIEAIKDIIANHPNIKVLFVGDGILYENIKEIINKYKLNNNIFLLGFRKDIERILNITDVVTLFSHHEGLPKNIMEAMAAEKPVICTKIRGNVDLIKHNKNGILVDINDIKSTQKAILKLYNDNILCVSMGKYNKEIIDKYSVKNVLKEVKEIYEKVID